MVYLRWNANAGITFVLDVEVSHTDHAIAKQLNNGSSRIQQRVKILPGLWQILNNVPSAENPLKRTRGVII